MNKEERIKVLKEEIEKLREEVTKIDGKEFKIKFKELKNKEIELFDLEESLNDEVDEVEFNFEEDNEKEKSFYSPKDESPQLNQETDLFAIDEEDSIGDVEDIEFEEVSEKEESNIINISKKHIKKTIDNLKNKNDKVDKFVKVTEKGLEATGSSMKKSKSKSRERAKRIIYEYHHDDQLFNRFRDKITQKKKKEKENEILNKELESAKDKMERAINKGEEEERKKWKDEIKDIKDTINDNRKYIRKVIKEVENVSHSSNPFELEIDDFKNRFALMFFGKPFYYHFITFFLTLAVLLRSFSGGSENPFWFILILSVFFSLSIFYIHSFVFNRRLLKVMKKNNELGMYYTYNTFGNIFELMEEFSTIKPFFLQTHKELANREGVPFNSLSDVPPQSNLSEELDESKGEVELMVDNSTPLIEDWKIVMKEVFNEEENPILPNFEKEDKRIYVFSYEKRGVKIDDFSNKKKDIVSWLGRKIVDIYPDPYTTNKFFIEVVKIPLPKAYFVTNIGVDKDKIDEVVNELLMSGWRNDDIEILDFPTPKNKTSIFLGINEKGFIEVDLNNNLTPHFLIAGTSGSGKGMTLHPIIKQLISQKYHVILADPAQVTFGHYEEKGYEVIYDLEILAETFKKLNDEMEWRMSLFSEANKNLPPESDRIENIEGFNKIFPDKPLQHIVLIIDEWAQMTEDEIFYEKVVRHFSSILRVARKTGIHIGVVMQDPLANTIGGDQNKGGLGNKARNNMGLRLAGKMEFQYGKAVINNKDYDTNTLTTGTFFMQNGGESVNFLKTPFFRPDMVKYVIKSIPYNPYENYVLHERDDVPVPENIYKHKYKVSSGSIENIIVGKKEQHDNSDFETLPDDFDIPNDTQTKNPPNQHKGNMNGDPIRVEVDKKESEESPKVSLFDKFDDEDILGTNNSSEENVNTSYTDKRNQQIARIRRAKEKREMFSLNKTKS